jgi:hypothetical protein
VSLVGGHDGTVAGDDPGIDEVADRLYGLAPDDFTAARDAAARDAPPDARRAIKALRRPTASAHVVNRLVRDDPAGIARLVRLGEDLRAALTSGSGQMRALSDERRRLVADLVDGALPDAVRRDVAATLEAASADADLAAEVLRGRLTKPLRYVGLGTAPAVAAAPRPSRQAELAAMRARVLELSGAADDAQRRYDAAVERVGGARLALERAEDACAEALKAAEAAHRDAERARDELGRLERS